MNIALIGSGGREHSLCHKIAQSSLVNQIFCIPGNAGTKSVAKNINIDVSDFAAIYKIVKKEKVDIVIVGPEQPLVDGVVDYLNKKNIKVFGPSKFASQLEGSKGFMKDLCKKYNIPTAKFGIFQSFKEAINFIDKNGVPIAVKADGLAAGKGVSICASADEAKEKTREILEGKFPSSKKVVLEEFLKGEELSYFVIADQNSYKFFGSAQDHKRVGEADTGPNTGGMGAYSPAPKRAKELEEKIKKKNYRTYS